MVAILIAYGSVRSLKCGKLRAGNEIWVVSSGTAREPWRRLWCISCVHSENAFHQCGSVNIYSYHRIRGVTRFQMTPELRPGMGEFDKLFTPTFVTIFGEFCLTCQFIIRRSLWCEKEVTLVRFFYLVSALKLSLIFVKFRMRITCKKLSDKPEFRTNWHNDSKWLYIRSSRIWKSYTY
jgi:hypothetical protein